MDEKALLDEAVKVVTKAGFASFSLLQEELGISFAKAAHLIDVLEEQGIVGPFSGGKEPREVLIGKDK